MTSTVIIWQQLSCDDKKGFKPITDSFMRSKSIENVADYLFSVESLQWLEQQQFSEVVQTPHCSKNILRIICRFITSLLTSSASAMTTVKEPLGLLIAAFAHKFPVIPFIIQDAPFCAEFWEPLVSYDMFAYISTHDSSSPEYKQKYESLKVYAKLVVRMLELYPALVGYKAPALLHGIFGPSLLQCSLYTILTR